MANKIGDLLIRIGYAFDSASLKQAEKELKRSGKNLADVGQSITLGLSAPLGAFGIAAIKAAGDIEGLSLAMKSTFANAGRSASEAATEIAALQEAAKAPGLEFEQAVRASIRLQSVGFSAEESRKTITELANAIAATGGSAENLTSVTQQFAQMASKGSVLQEDLSIIKENLPSISGLMQKAFGTTTAEGLRNLGITGKQFIEEMTKGMEGMARVEGGISNSITNAGSAITQFLAGVGQEINKTFDLSSKSDQFSAYLKQLGDTFKNLSDNTKQWIVKIGLFVVALGPALLVMSAIKSAAGQAAGAINSAITPLKAFADGYMKVANAVKLAAAEEILATKAVEAAKASTATATAILDASTTVKSRATAATKLLKAQEIEAAAASRLLAAQTATTTAATAAGGSAFTRATAAIVGGFKAMSAAAKAFVVIGIAVIVYEIAKAIYEWTTQLSAAEKEQKKINDLMAESEASIGAEKVAVQSLIGVINSETASKEAKLKAIQDLRKIDPLYYGDLTLENATIEKLTIAYDGYIANILASAKAKKAQEGLIKLSEEEAVLTERKAEAENKYAKALKDSSGLPSASTAGFYNPKANAALQAEGLKISLDNINKEIEANKNAQSQLMGIDKANYEQKAKNAAAAQSAQSKYDAEQAALTKAANDRELNAAASAEAAAAAKAKASASASEAIKMEAEQAKVLAENLKLVNDEANKQSSSGIKDIGEKVKIAEDNIRRLIDAGFDPLGKEVTAAKESFTELNREMLSMSSFETEGQTLINNLQALKNAGVDPTTEAYKEAEAAARAFFQAASQPIKTIPVAAPTAAGGGPAPDTVGTKVEAATIKPKVDPKELQNTIADTVGQATTAAFDILGNVQDASTQKELDSIRTVYAARLAAAEGNATLQAQIQAELDAKSAAIEKKAGKRKKRLALAEAAINTAVAITKNLANPIMAIAAAAAGAIQIGVIASQQFAKGTKDAPGGISLVGEKGPELVNLPRHSQVYTANQTKGILSGGSGNNVMLSGEFIVRGSDLVLALDRINQKQNRAR
jgi:tape measure domain-containing protein